MMLDQLNNSYKQLVRTHLEYCDFLEDSSLKKHVAKYDKVKKRALHTINYLCRVKDFCTNDGNI